MISNISITFGTKDFLSNIVKENPTRQLYLFASDNNNGNYELIDATGLPTIFKNPINYNVIKHYGKDNWHGYISYISLDLDDNQQKILDANIDAIISKNVLPRGMSSIYSLNVAKNKSSRIILTSWNNFQELSKWYQSKSANQLFKINDKVNSNYFETIYHAVK